jgi:hypothetical protein
LLDIQVVSPKRDYYVSLACQVGFVPTSPSLYLGCESFYTTDLNLFKRPKQLGFTSIRSRSPDTPLASIKGQLLKGVEGETLQAHDWDKEIRQDKNSNGLQADGVCSTGDATRAQPEEEKQGEEIMSQMTVYRSKRPVP